MMSKKKMEVRDVTKEDMKLKEFLCMYVYVYVWKATQKTTKQKQKQYD